MIIKKKVHQVHYQLHCNQVATNYQMKVKMKKIKKRVMITQPMKLIHKILLIGISQKDNIEQKWLQVLVRSINEPIQNYNDINSNDGNEKNELL